MSARGKQREHVLDLTGAHPGTAADARVALARQMIATPLDARLTEHDQALVQTIHDQLLAAIEDALRAQMLAAIDRDRHAGLWAAFETQRVRIAGPILAGHDEAEDDLVAAIIMRADEDRLFRRLRAAEPPTEPSPDPLGADADPAVDAAMRRLAAAEGRRFDRFGEPVVLPAEIPPVARARLTWRIAAALAHYMRVQHAVPPAESDRLATDAAIDTLAAAPDDLAADAASALVAQLDARARLDDELIVHALVTGRLAFAVAALAHATGLSSSWCWQIVMQPPGTAFVVLLRVAELSRAAAMRMLAALADDPRHLADQFDALHSGECAEILRQWRLDPQYRAMLDRLGRATT